MFIRLVIIFCFLTISFSGLTQEVFIGRIYDFDTRLPLSGVEIITDSLVTSTNVVGYFQINASSGKILKAQLNGYETQIIKIPTEIRFTFPLKRIETIEQADLKKSFYTYFGENIKYPAEARKKRVQGLTTIYFEVDSLNKIIKTEVLRPLGAGCSNEVLSVLANAPNVWFDIKGRAKFVLPIRFRLGNTKIDDMPDNPAPGIILLQELVVTAYSR